MRLVGLRRAYVAYKAYSDYRAYSAKRGLRIWHLTPPSPPSEGRWETVFFGESLTQDAALGDSFLTGGLTQKRLDAGRGAGRQFFDAGA